MDFVSDKTQLSHVKEAISRMGTYFFNDRREESRLIEFADGQWKVVPEVDSNGASVRYNYITCAEQTFCIATSGFGNYSYEISNGVVTSSRKIFDWNGSAGPVTTRSVGQN